MTTTQTKPQVELSRRNHVTYMERSILFGLIKWKVRVNVQKIGDDLIIITNGHKIADIYVDGEKLPITSKGNEE